MTPLKPSSFRVQSPSPNPGTLELESLRFRTTHSEPHSPSTHGSRVTGSLASLSPSSQEACTPEEGVAQPGQGCLPQWATATGAH